MARPSAAIPDFDADSPWGRYRPSTAIATRLAIAHRLPPAFAPLARALRKPVKYDLATPLDLIVWGLRLRLLPRGNISEEKLYTAPQLFDREEFAILRKTLKTGSVFVDVGANAGIYSFWAHRCMDGRGRCLAVEPDPEMGRRISFNIASNAISAIELASVALSDREGTAEFYINPQQRGTNTLETRKAGDSKRITREVHVTTLLALLQSRGIGSVDALKMDIEGHENTVIRHFLENAPPSLYPRIIICEFRRATENDMVALMALHGYRLLLTTKLNFIFERD